MGKYSICDRKQRESLICGFYKKKKGEVMVSEEVGIGLVTLEPVKYSEPLQP